MLRSEDEVLQEVLTFVPAGGARGSGRPRFRFYDNVKADLKAREHDIIAKTQEQFWEHVKVLADRNGGTLLRTREARMGL